MPKKGFKCSEETRKKLSEAGKGRECSEETRKKLSKNSARYWLGKKLSEETKRKIAKAGIGKYHTEESKKKMSRVRKKLWKKWRIERKGMLVERSKNLSKALKGKQVWNKGKPRSEETKRKISIANKGQVISKETRKKISIANKGHKCPEKVKKILSKLKSGKNNPNWNNGSSFEPYGVAFNKQLKEQIRKRDSYTCQECFRHQDELFTKKGRRYKLHIHHIDYCKKNNCLKNLIALCRSCHAQTNYKRSDWIKYFGKKKLIVKIIN